MKYAAGDIVGLLIFVGILIFQAVSHFINTAKEKKAQSPGQRANPPTTPPPARKSKPDSYDDPFDELMEALGKKPGQAPPQLPHPPENRPKRPVPPLTPAAPMQGEGPMRKVFIPEAPTKPVVVMAKSIPPAPEKSTTERQAELATTEHRPVFTTQIGSTQSASAQAAERIASHSTSSSSTPLPPHATAKSESLEVLLARLRKPSEVRRAIAMQEILSAPVALR